MSGEEKDRTYKPTMKVDRRKRAAQRPTSRRHNRQVNYTEIDVISSSGVSEETVILSESGVGSIKLEPGEVEQELYGEDLRESWMPGTLHRTATQVSSQMARLTETNKSLKMAREAEKSLLYKLMELMVTMRMNDEKRRQEKRRERIEKEKREKLEMLEREDRQKRTTGEGTEKEGRA